MKTRDDSTRNVSIIGTGLSAIFAARIIQERSDRKVILFDKARGVGGRLATRRSENGKFDHGLQYFDIESISGIPEIQELIEKEIITSISGSNRFFSPGGMTNIAKYLLQNHQINKEHKLTSISSRDKGFQISFENGKNYVCDDMILSSPIPQTLEILENSQVVVNSDTLGSLKKLAYNMCLVVMVESNNKLEKRNNELGLKVANGKISWIGDNYVKNVSDTVNFYTIHCSPEFSLDNFDNSNDEINEALDIELQAYFHGGYRILSNHKWRYSIPKSFYQRDTSLVLQSDGFLGLCGDIFTNGRFDGAIQSGISIAEKYLTYDF